MPVITVIYPSNSGTKFDADYYISKHIPLVKQRWGSLGMSDITVLRGIPGPDGAAPGISTMALLTFGSIEQFQQASKEHGREVFADVVNFTDGQPIVQFNDKAG